MVYAVANLLYEVANFVYWYQFYTALRVIYLAVTVVGGAYHSSVRLPVFFFIQRTCDAKTTKTPDLPSVILDPFYSSPTD